MNKYRYAFLSILVFSASNINAAEAAAQVVATAFQNQEIIAQQKVRFELISEDAAYGTKIGWVYVPKYQDSFFVKLGIGDTPTVYFMSHRGFKSVIANFGIFHPTTLQDQYVLPQGLYYWKSTGEPTNYNQHGRSLVSNNPVKVAPNGAPYTWHGNHNRSNGMYVDEENQSFNHGKRFGLYSLFPDDTFPQDVDMRDMDLGVGSGASAGATASSAASMGSSRYGAGAGSGGGAGESASYSGYSAQPRNPYATYSHSSAASADSAADLMGSRYETRAGAVTGDTLLKYSDDPNDILINKERLEAFGKSDGATDMAWGRGFFLNPSNLEEEHPIKKHVCKMILSPHDYFHAFHKARLGSKVIMPTMREVERMSNFVYRNSAVATERAWAHSVLSNRVLDFGYRIILTQELYVMAHSLTNLPVEYKFSGPQQP